MNARISIVGVSPDTSVIFYDELFKKVRFGPWLSRSFPFPECDAEELLILLNSCRLLGLHDIATLIVCETKARGIDLVDAGIPPE